MAFNIIDTSCRFLLFKMFMCKSIKRNLHILICLLIQDTEKSELLYGVLCQLFENQQLRPVIREHVKAFYTISIVKEKNQTFKDIWNSIISLAPFQSQWEKRFPKWWMERERVLMKKKSDYVKVQTFEEIKEINKHLIQANNSDNDVRLFLR